MTPNPNRLATVLTFFIHRLPLESRQFCDFRATGYMRNYMRYYSYSLVTLVSITLRLPLRLDKSSS